METIIQCGAETESSQATVVTDAVTETVKPAQSHTCPDASESTNTNKTFASNVLISEEISTEINSERNRAAESPRQDLRENETNDEVHELQENCEDQLTDNNSSWINCAGELRHLKSKLPSSETILNEIESAETVDEENLLIRIK